MLTGNSEIMPRELYFLVRRKLTYQHSHAEKSTTVLTKSKMPQGKLKAKVQLPKGVKQKQKSQKKNVLRKGRDCQRFFICDDFILTTCDCSSTCMI